MAYMTVSFMIWRHEVQLALFFAARTFFQTCWSEVDSVVMVERCYRIRGRWKERLLHTGEGKGLRQTVRDMRWEILSRLAAAEVKIGIGS